ncbi:hypothetical protein JD501_04165 [Aeromonas hydrophila]|uniref:hypothetical protein n=1 Tax=Aeromonas hydrophila TaxID=644 RepID=UPI00191D7782|nr:hypothetical protein [Aeromonas hydrophila]MBL0432422.1 hypothetical protein [Aeromonas hydrophila]MBL0468393.1 hypothetical protein [Aeromonas hydrophila]
MSSVSLTNKRQRALQRIQIAGYFGIPELKNPRYLLCFKDGRRAHLKAYLAASASTYLETIPLYSHHPTRQSLFAQGWRSVGELDRLRASARLTPTQPKEVHHA